MDQSAAKTIGPEEFFDWVIGREERYELVDGRIEMMAGASRRHDRIVVNLTATVHAQISKGPCQTFTGDTYIAVSPTTRRMPDLGVDCGRPDDESMTADEPKMLVEVLSPTTGAFDVTVKLAEYHALAAVDYIVFVDTEMPNVHLYARRDDGAWTDKIIREIDAQFSLPTLGVTLKMTDIYAGLEFRPRPRLVDGGIADPSVA